MINIPDKYIFLISSVPYNITREYWIPDEVIINYIKKFRKKLNVDDFIEFIKYEDNNFNYSRSTIMCIEDKISLLKLIFGTDLNFIFNDDQVLEIAKSFSFMKKELFVDFMNMICEGMFIGDDVDISKNIKELLKCRSYKIYLLLNSELC